jgi:hypothetical protein
MRKTTSFCIQDSPNIIKRWKRSNGGVSGKEDAPVPYMADATVMKDKNSQRPNESLK